MKRYRYRVKTKYTMSFRGTAYCFNSHRARRIQNEENQTVTLRRSKNAFKRNFVRVWQFWISNKLM